MCPVTPGRPQTPANVAESAVMGRSSAAFLVGVVQPVSLAQLAGVAEASQAVKIVGASEYLPDVWSGVAVLAGFMFLVSWAAPNPETQRVWEIAADVLVALASGVFTYAAVEAVGFSGAGWAASISLGYGGLCLSRAWLLVRQIWWVRHKGSAG